MVTRDIDTCGQPAVLSFPLGRGLYSSLRGQPGRQDDETDIFFYHPDHLGSTSYISDNSGMASQHVDYLPFGEVLLEEKIGNWTSPYKFNSKEMDEESGLYYYGARYYDPRTSFWLGVDPMSDKYPHQSNFAYCSNNPVRLIDPNGMDEWEVDLKGNTSKVPNTESKTDHLYALDKSGKRTGNVVELKKGLLDSKQNGGSNQDYEYYRTKNNKEGNDFFEFMASNTEVEWDHLKTTDNENYISTECDSKSSQGNSDIWTNLQNSGKNVSEISHSHPFKENRTYFGPSAQDNDNAKMIISQVKTPPSFKIFHPREGYVQYGPERGKYKPLDLNRFLKFRPGTF